MSIQSISDNICGVEYSYDPKRNPRFLEIPNCLTPFEFDGILEILPSIIDEIEQDEEQDEQDEQDQEILLKGSKFYDLFHEFERLTLLLCDADHSNLTKSNYRLLLNALELSKKVYYNDFVEYKEFLINIRCSIDEEDPNCTMRYVRIKDMCLKLIEIMGNDYIDLLMRLEELEIKYDSFRKEEYNVAKTE